MTFHLWNSTKNAFIIFGVVLTGMQIVQLSISLPKNHYSTDELIESFPCKLPDAVRQNVLNLGVTKRHLINQPKSTTQTETIINESSLVELCLESCENALAEAKIRTGEIGYFVTSHDASPFLSPSLSSLLVRELGFSPYVKHVNVQGAASTAFPKTLEVAENYLAARPEETVLICVSGVNSYWFQNQVQNMNGVMEIERINAIRDETTRQSELRKWVATMQFFLFGDGVAAAVVSSKEEGLAVKKIVEVTNLRNQDYLAGYARLSVLNEPFRFGFHSHLGKEIPKLGAEYSSVALRKLFGKNLEQAMKSAKKWAVHTGSEKILNVMAEHHGIEREKLLESQNVLRECGNLAGASLPFILERIVSANRFSKGDMILMLGYGWGFTASAGILQFST